MRWPGEPSLCELSYAHGGNLYRVLLKEMFAIEMRAALPICLESSLLARTNLSSPRAAFFDRVQLLSFFRWVLRAYK